MVIGRYNEELIRIELAADLEVEEWVDTLLDAEASVYPFLDCE